jgi:polysaccharide pyruvyl transferase WcaK-like protein
MSRTNFVTMRMGPVNRALTVRNFLGFQLQKRYSRQTGSVRIHGWGQEAHCRTMDDLETLVRASRLVVTGRFHMACLCLLLNTPLIALPSNSHKMEGMLEDLGLARRMMRPDEVTSGEMEQLSRWTDSESQAVTRYVREANNSINEMFREVRKLVDS